MLITAEESRARLDSPLNLANRFNLRAPVVVMPEENAAPLVTSVEGRDVGGNTPVESLELEGSEDRPLDGPFITEVPISRPGRAPLVQNLTEENRTEIAIRARSGESQTALAKEFNVSQPAISYIERGDAKGVDEAQVEKQLSTVRDKALDRLMSSLGLLTDDKLSGCAAPELSSIAANMSRIIEKTIPKINEGTSINLVIYSPELRKESGFKTLEI